MASDLNLIELTGAVVAPAGCGKTELIATTLKAYRGHKPFLVLTHTNAGVAALRKRLERGAVSSRVYRLATIDGWAMRTIATFPMRSGHNPSVLHVKNPRTAYPTIRKAARDLVASGHIDDPLKASYAKVIVDEYQDCSIGQHQLVVALAGRVSSCVLGDPMQAIFDFGSDPLTAWETALVDFPQAATLSHPWRWVRAGTEKLGRWLLAARDSLAAGNGVDLGTTPPEITWVRLTGGQDDEALRRETCIKHLSSDSLLIIGDGKSPEKQRRVASGVPRAIAVEAVDLRDLVDFASRWSLTAKSAFEDLLRFVATLMTNVEAEGAIGRHQVILAGRARKQPTPAETAGVAFARDPSFAAAAEIVGQLRKQSGVRVYRQTTLHVLTQALRSPLARSTSFAAAVMHAREHNRFRGRDLPPVAVGSTLLLKGLEADVVVILNADELTPRNLYVALTRGAKQITVCSSRSVIGARP